MKLFTVFILLISLPVLGQKFNTGDKSLDQNLTDINLQAKADSSSFSQKLKADFKINDLTYKTLSLTMSPAEIYLSTQLSLISKKSLEEINTSYLLNKIRGWSVVIKEMGVQPKSTEFEALKTAVKNQKLNLPVVQVERKGTVVLFYDQDAGVILEEGTNVRFDFNTSGAQTFLTIGDNVTFFTIRTPDGRDIVKQVIKK